MPGDVYMQVQPGADSPYARMGRDVELGESLSGMDFAMPLGATLAGRVVDAETAEPIARVHVNHWSERHTIWQSDVSDEDGCFTLTHLPPGIAEIEIDSLDDPSRVWLSWPASLISLDEGQDAGGRVIALGEGVLVRGYVRDTEGAAVAGCEIEFFSTTCEGEAETDEDGFYEVCLPAGEYTAILEFGGDEDPEGQWASTPVRFTVSAWEELVEAPEIVAYSFATGSRISGAVVNSGGWGGRSPAIAVLEAGTLVTSETFAAVGAICDTTVSQTGEFIIPILPPGNYDIYLTAEYWDEDDVGSFIVCDRIVNVPAGASGITLSADLSDGSLEGYVLNAAGRPVLAATVFIADASGVFAGSAETGVGGAFSVENVGAGTYTLTAVHPKYVPMQRIVDIADGLVTTVDTFVLAFAGGKEASDLNGAGPDLSGCPCPGN